MTKQTSQSLIKEIAGLTDRRAQLAAEIEKARQSNDEAQANLVATGSSDAMQQAATCFASFSSLKAAVTTLDGQIGDKQLKLEEAEAFEQQATNRNRAAECLREIEEAEVTWRQARIKAHAAMLEAAPVGVDAWNRRADLRAEYTELAKQIGAAPLTNRVDGVENLEPFGYLIDQAFQCQANLTRRSSRAERKAATVERGRAEAEGAQRRNDARRARELEARKVNESGWTRIATDSNPQRAA